MTPGSTIITLIPHTANSLLKQSEIPCTAYFDPVYALEPKKNQNSNKIVNFVPF